MITIIRYEALKIKLFFIIFMFYFFVYEYFNNFFKYWTNNKAWDRIDGHELGLQAMIGSWSILDDPKKWHLEMCWHKNDTGQTDNPADKNFKNFKFVRANKNIILSTEAL